MVTIWIGDHWVGLGFFSYYVRQKNILIFMALSGRFDILGVVPFSLMTLRESIFDSASFS